MLLILIITHENHIQEQNHLSWCVVCVVCMCIFWELLLFFFIFVFVVKWRGAFSKIVCVNVLKITLLLFGLSHWILIRCWLDKLFTLYCIQLYYGCFHDKTDGLGLILAFRKYYALLKAYMKINQTTATNKKKQSKYRYC